MADQNKSKTAIKKKLSSPATAQFTEGATEDTTTAKTNKSPPGAKTPTKKSATKDPSLSDTLKGVSTQKIIDEIVEEELKMNLLKRFADLKGLPMESDDLITTLLNKNTPKKKAPAKPKKTPQPKKQANSPSDETEKSAIKSSPTTTTATPTIPKTNQSPKPTAASKNIETTQVDSNSDSSDESESVLPKANIASQVTKKMTPPPTTINKPAATSSSSDSEDEATVEKQKPTPPKPPQQKGGIKLLSTSTKLIKANYSDTSDDEVTAEPITANKPLPTLPAKTTPPVAKKESSTDSSSSDDEAPPEPVKKQSKPSPPNKQTTPAASKNTKPADIDTSSSSSDENQPMDTAASTKKLSFKPADATKQSSAPAKTQKKNENDASSDSDSSSDSDEAEAQVGLKPGMKRSGLGANSSTKFSKTEPDADDDESSETVTAYFGKLSYDLDVDGLQNFLKKKGIKYTSARIITQNDGQSKGFGYVDLPDRSQLAKCVKLNGTELEGMKIKVDEAGARSAGTSVTPRGNQGGQGGFNRSFKNDTPESSNRLKLSNLSYNTTSDKLTSVFPSAVDVFIVKDKETGDSRGFGFVEFSTVDEAKKMMKKYTGKNIDGRDIRLEFAGERPSPGGQRGGQFGGRNSFGNKPFGGGNNYGGNRGHSNARAMKSGAIQQYSGTKKKFGSNRYDDDSD